MTEEDKKILEKICKKNGVVESTMLTVFCELKSRYAKVIANDWLRGVLLDMDVILKIFGEEETCPYCGGNEIGDTLMSRTCAECGFIDDAEIYPYKYHATQMVLLPDNHQILEYYDKYL